MKKIHNIFIKMFLLLAFAIGWGGSAWAERLTPAFDGTYYYIKFANINRYMYNGSSVDVEISTNAPGTFRDERYMWQLVGDASSFQLVNANGQYLKLTGSRGDNNCYQLANGADGAANFTLDEWSTTGEFWELKNLGISGKVWVNPRPNSSDNFVSHWNDNDNNNKVEFVPVEAPLLKASPAPEAGSWGDGTQWYKIHNVRAASRTDKDGYLATEGENFVDGEGNLKLWAAGEPEGDASLWCLVLAENGCVNIYNKGTGTSKVLGTVNNAGDGGTRSKMCVGTGSETNVTKAYCFGTNEEGFWICLSGTNKHLDENNSSGYLSVYDNNSDTKTNPGNRFIFHEVITTIPVTPMFDPAAGNVTSLASVTVNFTENVYNVVDSETAGMPSGAVQLMPEILRHSDDAVVATATSVNSSGFGKPYTITFNTALPDGEYTLRIPDGTFYVLDGSTWTAAAGARVNYTLVTPPATEGYEIIINGDNGYTVTTTAAINSGRTKAVHGEFLDLADAPAATDLTINCTDKFVWGPAIDDVNKTITFDVRDAASSFTAGRWYQLQMREKTGKYYTASSQEQNGNLVDGVNSLNPRFKGSYIYLAPGNKESSWSVELFGKPTDAYTTYFYVPAATTTTLQLQQQNGKWVNNQSQSSNTAANINIEALSGNAFWWKDPVYPWGGLNDMQAALGKAGTTAGPIEFFAHPVKSGEDYAMYKVVLSDGDVATYTGGSTLYVATGAELSTTKIAVVNGDVIFLPKGTALQLTDFTFSEGGEHIFTEDKSSDIWTLNMMLPLDGEVTLRFVDENGDPTTACNVTYHPSNGGADVELAATETSYTFSNEFYTASLFTISTTDYNLSTSYDAGTKTLTFTLTEIVPEWYTMKPNNGGYISSDYANADGRMHVNNGNAKPTNYAGIWAFKNVQGVDGQNLVNAKYLNNRVLSVVGTDGSAVAMMDPAGSIRSDARYKFKIASNGFVQVQGESLYLGNHSMNLVVRGNTSDGSLNLNLTRVPNLGKNVTVRVKDGEGNAYAPGVVFQTQCEDSTIPQGALTLTDGTTVNFHNMPFLASLFSISDAEKTLNINFDEGTQTLTLTVIDDPNLLKFSDAPVDGAWAANTKWFTWRSNRSNQNAHNRHFMSTSANSVTDDYSLAPTQDTMPADRGSYWCFVGDNTSGFQIYNAAYGPDFVLGCIGDDTSAKYQMVLKDEAAGYNTIFTSVESTVNDGASHGYAFRLGTSGKNHIHVTNSTIRNWSNDGITTDTGSSFRIERAELPEGLYDIYRVGTTVSPELYTSLDYATTGNTFGKRSTAKEGDFLILNHGAATGAANFTIEPSTEFTIQQTQVNEVAGHYYKRLIIDIDDQLATDAYQMIINQPADDHNAYRVTYRNEPLADGDYFSVRPGIELLLTGFTINNPDGKFIWGPVIDSDAKTVTFTVRNLATELTTGPYQLMLIDDNGAYETITKQIGMFTDNINTPSSYYYLMPSRYQAGGMTFKFSGVPSEQLVDGGSRVAPSICYIEKESDTNCILRTDGGLTVNLSSFLDPLQFENGVLTVTNWLRVSDEQEPLEMPALGRAKSEDQRQTLRFLVVPADLSDIEAYRLVLNPSSPSTKVTLRCPTANGLQTFVEGDVISMPVGGMFQLSDFSPSDCRVLSFSTTAATDGTEINTLTLNIEKAVLTWKGIIKSDAGVNVSGYKVKCGSTEYNMQLVDGIYKTEDAIDIPAGAVPREVVSTTCDDKFVWGPIVDEEVKTITFDIRPVPATLEAGFYQLMLIEDPDNADNSKKATAEKINNRIKANGATSINTTGSYIYVMPPYDAAATGYLAKYNGIPGYGAEPVSFFHIGEINASQLRLQTIKGKYANASGRPDQAVSNTPVGMTNYNFANGIIDFPGWVPPGYWSGSGNGQANDKEGPAVAYGTSNVTYEKYYITKVDLSNYDVYRLSILDASDNVVEGTISCESTLGPQDVLTGGYFFFPAGATVSAGRFKAYSYKFVDVSAADAEGVKTITFRSLDVTNTILHRQHDVYDYIESIDPTLRPQGSAFIKPGEGMKPSADGSVLVQNTSEFFIDLYAKQNTNVECVLPYTSGKDQGGSHISTYQRWYNYDTESRLADAVFTANGLSGFDSYDNGYVAKSSSNILSKALISFPEVSCLKVGVDCSDWTDSSKKGSNLIEPSLNMRVVYLIHDAKEIATKLAACPGSGTTYLENHTYYVPNVKNSSNVASNNIDLLPLDMAWSNYWMFDGSGTANTNLVPLIGDTQELPDNFASETNGRVRVSTDRDDLLDVGVFLGQDGVDGGNLKYANANHFAWYKIKGPDGRRSVPNGTTAHVRVQINDGNGHWYNLAEYTLNFIADAEPLILTSVIGNPQSHRSTDYFISNNLIEVASLTFANPRVDFRTSNININPSNKQERTEKRKADLAKRTYAFPIDFSRTSYGYTHAHEYAEYKISTQGYGFKFNPVTLYEKNIKNPTSTQMEMPDDYYLYIDAAEQPGKVATIPFDGDLCSGSRLYCYGWMGSANRAKSSSASVVLNVVERKGSTERVIASYLPGTMSNYAYDIDGRAFRSLSYGRTPTFEEGVFLGNDDNVANSYPVFGAWQQIGFNFYMPAVDPGATYELQIINNCYSTDGGDYCLDDFRVFVSPPTADVDFSTPLCNDDIAHIKIHTPHDLLSDADQSGGSYKVSYCFLDKEVYDKLLTDGLTALSAGATEEQIKAAYDVAFNAALMGNHTATDIPSGQKRSFWNMAVPIDFATIPAYSFSGTWDEEQVYSETVNNENRVILVKSISDNTWKDNHKYYIAFKKGWVESDFDHAASAEFGLASGSACAFLREFTVKPSVVLNGDIDVADADALVACDGQTAAFTVVMNGIGPDGEVQKVNLEYDWWIGDGQPDHPATASAFLTVEHGGVRLNDALDHFRSYYTREATLQGVVPQSGPDLYGRDDHQLTQADIDCIAHFLLPDANGRVPLILCKRNLNTTLRKANAHREVVPGKESLPDSDPDKYDYYLYFTIIPITPAQAFSSEDNAIFCPDPQQIRVRLNGKAPSMVNGFGDMTYPAGMDAIPVRAGLHQIEAVRLKAGSIDKVLRVPLRNVNTVYGAGSSFVIKQQENGNYLDNIVLTSTDDPAYIDRVVVSNQDGQLEFLPIGKVSIYSAMSQATDAYMQIAFAGTFQPREGYTYTLKCAFAEDVSSVTIDSDHPAPCPSSLFFDLKIVPEFQQWTYNAGNTDWTNDINWARADRDALHADNATSEGARPLATYAANAINYAGDHTFNAADRKTAHGFVPMYFTNVLLYSDGGKADVSTEPAVNPAYAPYLLAEGGKDTNGFLSPVGGSTATPLIQYDMLVTPIDNSNQPLSPDDIPARLAHVGNYGCELFWTNVCNGLTFEPGTMMYDAQHLQYNRVWVEYELETNRWYTLASPLKGTYAGEWYSPEAGGRQLTPHFYPVTYNPALNDRFNPAYYQRSWDKAGQAWIYRMAGDDDTYVGFDQQNLNSGSVRVQKPVYLNWSYVYNDVAVDYSNGGFSVNAHYTDTDTDGHLLNATGGKVLVRLPKDDLSYDYYQSEAAAHYDETHPAGGNEQNPDPTQPGTVPGRDDYGNGDNDTGNNPDGSNADGSGNASGRNNANGNSNEYTPQQGNHSHNGDNTTLPGRSATEHPRLMSDDLNLSGGTIGQNIQNASATNPYYLVGNPFMAPMNMDKFFAQQTCTRGGQTGQPTFEAGKYWILNGTSQEANIKVDGQWVSTSAANAGVVAPLQGFFVQLPTNSAGQLLHPDAASSGASGVQLSFDKNVQQPMTVIGEDPNGKPIFGYIAGEDAQGQTIRGEKPSLKSRRRSAELEQPTMFRITATNGSQLESTAVVYFHDNASAHYDAREDAETLLDGNIASKVSTVFTSAPSLSGPQDELVSGQDQQALQINTIPVGVTVIPVGVIAPKDDTRTTLRFTGLDALEAAMPETPHLYDADNGTLQVLDEGTTVSVTGTTAGRYFIVSGTTLPVIDDNDDDNDDYDGRIYDLRGIRVNSVQHGTVTISRSRKEYNK